MKINIITIQYAHNYGAVLQAYSLKRALKNLGHKVNVVNYIPENEKNKYVKKLRNEVGLKYSLKQRKIWKYFEGLIISKVAQKEWNIRFDNFERFIKSELINNSGLKKYEDLCKETTDCWICGSDQIWNKVITGTCNPVYYLDFPQNVNKISYAASMGNVEKPSSEEKETIKKWLNNFDAISVREQSLKDLIEEEYNLNIVKVVADPCMLLKADDFKEMFDSKSLEKEEYILNYFISESGLLKKNFRKINRIDNKDIIEIHWKKQLFQKNKNQRNSLSVSEFLNYIYNAQTIYTDSFHGVLFSLLFHKNFYAVYEKNARIESLLKRVGLQDRHITSIDKKEKTFITNETWKNVDEKINEFREESINYLKEVLK